MINKDVNFIIEKNRLDRRTVLKAAGAIIALPSLESMASEKKKSDPVKFMFLGFGYGVTREKWYIDEKQKGANYTFTEALKPLEENRKNLSILSNLSTKDLGNSHWGCTRFLTGKEKQISIDQQIAQKYGSMTRYNSLSVSGPSESGMGPGLSLSWDAMGNTIPGIKTARDLFETLFLPDKMTLEEKNRHLKEKRSVLDITYKQAKKLRVSSKDKSDIEQYMASIRDIEKRLQDNYHWSKIPKAKAPFTPKEFSLKGTPRINLIYDLLVAALQSNSTNVCSYRIPLLEIIAETTKPCGPHPMSHYHSSEERTKTSLERDIIQAKQLNHLINRMKNTPTPKGSLLDESLISYGSCLRSGHTGLNSPMIIAGGAQGKVRQGQHYVFESRKTPMTNLWLTMSQLSGIENDKFSTSTGTLNEILT